MNTKKPSRNRHRSNGDGSVYDLKSKRTGVRRYRWTITLGYDAEGKQVRRGGVCPTKTEANNALREAKTQHLQGKLVMPRNMTLWAFIELWLNEQQPYISSSTDHQRRIYAKSYLPQKLKDRPIQSVRYRDLLELDRGWIDQGLKASTRRKALSILKMVFRAAMAEELIGVNPSAEMKIKVTTQEEQAQRKKKILEPDEIRAFMDEAQGHQHFGVLYSLFALGLRRGEALGIRWGDVDWTNSTIQISQQVRLVGNRPEIGPLKTTESRRLVRCSPAMLQILEGQRRRQEGWKTTSGELWTDSDLVFTTQIGTMIHPKNINNTIETLCRKLGIPRFSSHTGRHTYVSALLSRNEPVDLVAAVVGHKNSNVTREVYRHHFANERKEILFDLEHFIAAK